MRIVANTIDDDSQHEVTYTHISQDERALWCRGKVSQVAPRLTFFCLNNFRHRVDHSADFFANIFQFCRFEQLSQEFCKFFLRIPDNWFGTPFFDA
jgi:hypothetical protein